MTWTAVVVAAVLTGCIAGVAFAASGMPTPGAVIMGAAVVVLVLIIQAAVAYAGGDQRRQDD